jgi:general secretion pathway protein M
MRRSSLSQRLLALLLTITVAYSIYAFVEPWLEDFAMRRERRAELSERLQKYRRLAANQPALEEALQRLQGDTSTRAAILSGTTPALGAAALQNHLRKLAKDAAASVHSIRTLPAGTEQQLTRITISARLTASTPSLRRLLHGLETTVPVTLVDSLSVRARYTPGRNQAQTQQLLNVDLQVSGFMPEQKGDS